MIFAIVLYRIYALWIITFVFVGSYYLVRQVLETGNSLYNMRAGNHIQSKIDLWEHMRVEAAIKIWSDTKSSFFSFLGCGYSTFVYNDADHHATKIRLNFLDISNYSGHL